MKCLRSSFFPSWQENRGGWICFGLLLVLSLFGHFVHEPWYDEAQSWQIARTADWYDILFRIPHYEGHPPFWHLLLAIPAKISGLSWRWVYPLIGMICTAVSGFLIIFKAPFPRWIRFTLPFTYFLFYQYGVIVRPYSIMVLLMILLAIAFPSKDEHPGRFVGLLAGLCACHLFGIAIAGGITIAWLLDIKDSRPWSMFLRGLVTDRRFYWMLGLLGCAVLLLVNIIPASDTAAYLPYRNSVFLNILYALVILPADSVLTNYSAAMFIRIIPHTFSSFVPAFMVGLVLWGLLLGFLPRKNWKYLLCPYLLLAALCVCYCSRHHIGLAFLLILWAGWITLQCPNFQMPRWPKQLRQLGKAVLVLSLLTPVIWSGSHLFFDTKTDVFSGEQTVRFLKEHHLLDKRIFATWKHREEEDQSLRTDVYDQPWSVQLNLYVPHNIVSNFHYGGPKAYSSFEALEKDNTQNAFAKWRAGSTPEVLMGAVRVQLIWPELDILENYIPVHEVRSAKLWKLDTPRSIHFPIYVRKDIAAQLQLQSIQTGYSDGAETL